MELDQSDLLAPAYRDLHNTYAVYQDACIGSPMCCKQAVIHGVSDWYRAACRIKHANCITHSQDGAGLICSSSTSMPRHTEQVVYRDACTVSPVCCEQAVMHGVSDRYRPSRRLKHAYSITHSQDGAGSGRSSSTSMPRHK